MYGIEVKLSSGAWKAVNPPCGPPPYCFKTEAEAETFARILYPELTGLKARGGEELIRIRTAPVPAGWAEVEGGPTP